MDLQAAKELLGSAIKWENRDHAFGDCEVGWEKDGKEIASGYFGGGHASVSLSGDTPGWFNGECSWDGEEAHELRKCFAKEVVGRNDETGPDTYSEGTTMPGLTLEGVRKEITGA